MNRPFPIIDIWNIDTFDDELRCSLDARRDIICDYVQSGRSPERLRIREQIMRQMEARTIRAWHYTRLTDAEIGTLRQVGIYLSSLVTIRSRLNTQVAAGAFTQEVADRIFADSPYNGNQFAARADKFWMVSHPIEIDYCGVSRFLESWGGESAYFWQRDAELNNTLKQIGRPRVLEIAMPLSSSRGAYSAAEAVVATYERMLGGQPEKHVFDLYREQPLDSSHILAIHSQGEPNFDAIARGYPVGFVDVDL